MAQDSKELKNTKKKRFGKFFKETKSELKKVSWPSRTQLINNTVTVLISCFLIGAIIWVMDLGFEWLYSFIFK